MPNQNPNPPKAEFRLTDRVADNWETSKAAQDLKRLQENPRVKYIVIIVPDEACPACQELTGTYPKDQVPHLPVESCSNPMGCCAYYLPYLDEIYP